MRIWIVEDGERRGPFEVYELRDRIERGELTGGELSWHEALDSWAPLRELDVFHSEFENAPAGDSTGGPPPLPQKPRPFLRFLARSFDLVLYSLVLWGGMTLFGADLLKAALSPLFNLLSMVPLFVIEAGMIHLWAATPGKALLGLAVRSSPGRNLGAGASMLRAARVYIIGLGLLHPLLIFLCGGFSLWFTLRKGKTPWDSVGNHHVSAAGPTPVSLLVFTVLFTLMLLLLVFGIFAPLALEMREAYPDGLPTA